ncbi:glutamate-5-semialdehyde dehydrogenase [Acidisoma cellulosilytica]|uniref:Gamma-glutamyl phosphate reductase n=1 Tax=Acidisoma cellulosilyticum TaxID=2802395 RepID=A0A963YXT4_9PROT|nr:glutamate-5-semialdehyde dehydrogenase [Acidisoma cellulosilyticum]MCB8878784.1 glutamate-5-semialdehyde dehydrogenase [Acidisoma cellulosilyticum]
MNIDVDPAAADLRSAGLAAREATRILARSSHAARQHALRAGAAALRAAMPAVLDANAIDLAGYQGTPALRDRLRLDAKRVEGMAVGLEEIANLPDPLGRVQTEWTRPNGLDFRRISTPIGIIGMIYESRPNVGADAAGLCLASGNAVILRGGSDSFNSAQAIHAAIVQGLREAGLPEACVQIAPNTDRAFVAAMLKAAGLIDLIIPRGGKGLVTRVQAESRVPVLSHADGLCHTYIHAAADTAMARTIMKNAKMRRTDVCGATETLLIDAAIAPSLLPEILSDLKALGCDFRADARAREILPDLTPAAKGDFSTEWLDKILSVAVVDGVEDAMAHIARHGSEHTEAIITEDAAAAEQFLNGTSSAVVLWNASTQFCDGGEFGFGAEIGIATGRIHARGPVGVEQLTTFRYQVRGSGQVRP